MLIRSHFDPLLTEKFFTLPKENALRKPHFPLPQNKETINAFMESYEGQLFVKGIKDVVTVLNQWCIDHKINTNCNIVDENNKIITVSALNYFEHITERYAKDHKVAFELYQQGMPLLIDFIFHLLEEKQPKDICISTVKNLLPDLVVCAPGVYKAIYTAHLKIVADPDTNLMDIRKEKAEQVALELIKSFNEQLPLFAIPEGNVTHFVNRMLNAVAVPIGIKYIEDALMPPETEHTVKILVEEFIKRLPQVLKLEDICEVIGDKFGLEEFQQEIKQKPEEISQLYTNFEEALDLYGPDPNFHASALIEATEVADYQYTYTVTSEAVFHLHLTFFQRLIASGYANVSSGLQEKINNKDKIYFLPNRDLRLAYVVLADNQRIPFVSYCIDQLSKGETTCVSIAEINKANLFAMLSSLLFNDATPVDRRKQLIRALRTMQIFYDKQQMSFAAFLGMENFCKNIDTLSKLMSWLILLEPQERLVWVLSLPNTYLSVLIKKTAHPIELFLCLPKADAIKLALVFKERNLMSAFVTSLEDIVILMDAMTEQDISCFLSILLNTIDLQALNITLEKLLALAKVLTEKQIIWFFNYLGHEFWRDQVVTSDAFALLLEKLPLHLYGWLIHVLGNAQIEVLTPNFERLIDILGKVNQDQRIYLLNHLGHTHVRRLVKNWDELGFVLSMLNHDAFMSFLNLIAQDNINHIKSIVSSAPNLVTLLKHLNINDRMSLLKQLGSCLLQELTREPSSIAKLALLLDPSDYRALFRLLGKFHVMQVISDGAKLQSFLADVPAPNADAILTAFVKCLSPETLHLYRGDERLFDKMMACKKAETTVSAAPAVSASQQGFFGARASTGAGIVEHKQSQDMVARI